MRELEDKRKSDYDRSERRIGVTKEVWYLAHTPVGDQFVAYVEAEDFAGALSLFSGSQEEFDLWFKRRLADSTGLGLNTPPSAPASWDPAARGQALAVKDDQGPSARRRPPTPAVPR